MSGTSKPFIFSSYTFDEEKKLLLLNYQYDIHTFQEQIDFHSLGIKISDLEQKKEVLHRIFFMIHLACGMSYFKAFCPREIEIQSGLLDQDQSDFWNQYYTKGLGEFFYKNDIDFRDLIHFPFQNISQKIDTHIDLKNEALVPIGGGKDSIVSAELLQKNDIPFTTFSLNEHRPIQETVKILETPHTIVYRKIDPKLLELNASGSVFNGHVAITGILSTIVLAVALMCDKRWIILSLEKSSNYGQVEYLGEMINHQYSKSQEFQENFQLYITNYIAQGVEYISLLRSWYEIKIVEIFAPYFEKYQDIFTSCNKNFKIIKEKNQSKWCGECPKCAFMFALFSAFIPKEKLIETFQKNCFEDEKLIPLYEELLGISGHKPFECVGTPEETKLAFALAYTENEYNGSIIMKLFIRSFEKEIPSILEQKKSLLPEDSNEILQYLIQKMQKE